MTSASDKIHMNNGLGRGLGSLIPQKINKAKVKSGDIVTPIMDLTGENEKDKILNIEPDKIMVNPMQPRQNFSDFNMEELEGSIREYGIIQPLIVTNNNGGYELIAGERRLRAARKVGLEKVPVIVRDADSQKKLEIALVENLQRENLNPIETAVAYRKLTDEFNIDQNEVARRVGKARSSVANTMRLLNLPDEIQVALIQGKIGEGHAKYLLGLDTEEKQLSLFRKIIRNNLTVSDTSQEARRIGGTKQARIKINYADKDKEFAFREFFTAKVEIKRKGKGGQVIIDFYSDEELAGMAEKLKK